MVSKPVAPDQVITADLGPGATGFFTTAAGGVSSGLYGDDGRGGLNLGPHVGDEPAAVSANRRLLSERLGARVGWMDQVHGAEAIVIDSPLPEGRLSWGSADALIATRPAAAESLPPVAVMVADCVPLLLADRFGRCAAAVHVGRAGLVRGVVHEALRALRGLGVEPSQLWASLGPSICGGCYEVSTDIRDEVAGEVPVAWATTTWGTPSVDVARGVRYQLEDAGVEHIETHTLCTFTDARFYSYRRSGVTGRFAGVVWSAGATASRLGVPEDQ